MEGVTLPTTPMGWAGWILAFATLGFNVLTQRRKGRIDESALILGKWKEMVDAHEADLKALREELRTERSDNDALRKRLREAEDTIRKQGQEIEGLKRTIAQMGQSTAIRLDGRGDLPPGTSAAVKKLADRE